MSEDGVGDWSGAAANQRMPRITGHYQELKEGRKDAFLESSKRGWLHRHIDFIFLPFRTEEEYFSVELSYPLCGNLLQLPKEMNASC